MTDDSNKSSGTVFLILALLAFSGLGMELALGFGVEPLLFGKSFAEYTVWENVLHWVVTCIVWFAVAYALVKFSQKRGFDFLAQKERLNGYNWSTAAVLLVISIAASLWDWNGIKIIKEYEYNGLIKFIFQYIYYIMETVLVLLIIIFGQHAGELWFKHHHVPWGGVLVALTWGLVHMLTKNDLQAGLLSAGSGLLFGIAYLAVRRNVYIAYPLILLMFVL